MIPIVICIALFVIILGIMICLLISSCISTRNEYNELIYPKKHKVLNLLMRGVDDKTDVSKKIEIIKRNFRNKMNPLWKQFNKYPDDLIFIYLKASFLGRGLIFCKRLDFIYLGRHGQGSFGVTTNPIARITSLSLDMMILILAQKDYISNELQKEMSNRLPETEDEYPEIMTRGETIEELEENLRDAYEMMMIDDVPDGQINAIQTAPGRFSTVPIKR